MITLDELETQLNEYRTNEDEFLYLHFQGHASDFKYYISDEPNNDLEASRYVENDKQTYKVPKSLVEKYFELDMQLENISSTEQIIQITLLSIHPNVNKLGVN